jgi:acetylornithine deacetylase
MNPAGHPAMPMTTADSRSSDDSGRKGCVTVLFGKTCCSDLGSCGFTGPIFTEFELSMPESCPQSVEEILAKIVSIPALPGKPNGEIVDWIQVFLRDHGVDCRVLPGPEGDRSNLFATIGPADRPGAILSGHMDVVPVEGQAWTVDPFRLTELDGRLTGRGTTDMKGFLACVLAMVPEFKKQELVRPIHIAFSYDEEIGCGGVPHLIARLPDLCAPASLCVVGEPSDMSPVLSHKGKQAVELTFHGKPAHSSNPAMGENAIYPAAEAIVFIRSVAKDLADNGPFDPDFDPPHSTLVASVVDGGSAVNIIPERCRLQFEVRAIPDQSPREITDRILRQLENTAGEEKPDSDAVHLSHIELSSYPALAPMENPALIAQIERLSGRNAIRSVSYGTEAGLFQTAGIPSVICGPGSIKRAHRPDEFILREELADCVRMLNGLAEQSRV